MKKGTYGSLLFCLLSSSAMADPSDLARAQNEYIVVMRDDISEDSINGIMQGIHLDEAQI